MLAPTLGDEIAGERMPEYEELPEETARALLMFEAAHPHHNGTKEIEIQRGFGFSPARYYQLLHRLIDTVQALRIDPMLTNRLRRIRDTHAEARRARGVT